MTIPKEIRNKIYMYVFCDHTEYVREPIRYDWDVEAVIADAPVRVPLDQTPPQSKETILACRQLHEEMKEMQAAANRAYWSNKRFIYDAGQLNHRFPADKDLQHIQQFCLVLRHLPNYYIHLVFEGGKWEAWFLPVGDRILGTDDFGLWLMNQDHVKDAVAEYMASKANDWTDFDPSEGHGLTCEMLQDISRDHEVNRGVQCQHDYETSQRPCPALVYR